MYAYNLHPLLNFGLRPAGDRALAGKGGRKELLPSELLPGGSIPKRRGKVIYGQSGANKASASPHCLLPAAGALRGPPRQKLRLGFSPPLLRGRGGRPTWKAP